ncbi:hypothetical protein TNCV_887061 [Trichonephila clavipes]|uniref:Uncharacterized protein n=1 Tax=Trichonephila clavipes TaxID=2585209 RepID=A0A8X6R7U1_TRICX|nr:hypothetical protein TNCV_887061 [Trichonephila clavipes]
MSTFPTYPSFNSKIHERVCNTAIEKVFLRVSGIVDRCLRRLKNDFAKVALREYLIRLYYLRGVFFHFCPGVKTVGAGLAPTHGRISTDNYSLPLLREIFIIIIIIISNGLRTGVLPFQT